MGLQLLVGLSLLCLLNAADPYVSRPTCGSTGRACIKHEASCTNGQCVCNKPAWGRGDFRCYDEKSVVCELKGDPALISYSKEVENFPYPCRYLATHVKTDLKDKNNDVIGKCEAKVHGFNGKADGKHIVLGFDVSIKIQYDSPPTTVVSTLRHRATTLNNINTILKRGKNGVFDDSYTSNDDVTYRDNSNGVNVFFTWDNKNNRFIYKAEGCGVHVIHTPFDVSLKLQQKQVPGLSVEVSKNNEPEYQSNDQAMCLAPTNKGGALYADIKNGELTVEQSLLLRAFKSGVTQNTDSGANAECSSIAAELNSCQIARQRSAIQKCDWILKNVHFIKCYDKTLGAAKLLQLFDDCVNSWCSNRNCASAISKIQDAGCDQLTSAAVPELAAFLSGHSCPAL